MRSTRADGREGPRLVRTATLAIKRPRPLSPNSIFWLRLYRFNWMPIPQMAPTMCDVA